LYNEILNEMENYNVALLDNEEFLYWAKTWSNIGESAD
jgi:hypothetical protein